MLFHADKATKENLFHLYKKDAEDHQNRKITLQNQKIQDERNYLNEIEKKEQMEMDKKKLEKIRMMSQSKSDYLQMMNQKEEEKRRKGKYDVNINTYGAKINKEYENNINNYHESNDIGYKVPITKKFEIQNNYSDAYDIEIKTKKQDQQRMYKKFLDNQVFSFFI